MKNIANKLHLHLPLHKLVHTLDQESIPAYHILTAMETSPNF